ncbi:hypothetical protein [Herpetosiphon gulosus]|uniref:Uncharacterized protein n=1 Tax=Herpetosiphon gulosus TaxID=1973496 RepID=A0ABP9WY10_9CHLR
MNADQKIHKLKQALKAVSPLSFQAAQAQIPQLVIAELSGVAIEQEYALVLQALDQYPELAEEYALQMEEQLAFLAETDPLPKPSNIPTFFPKPVEQIKRHTALTWGQLLQNFLIQLNPPLLAKSLDADPGQTPADDPAIDSIEYLDHVVTHEVYQVNIQATLQRIPPDAWQLAVSVASVPPSAWKVGATLNEQALTMLEHQPPITTFGPLPTIPSDPIFLAIAPDQTP